MTTGKRLGRGLGALLGQFGGSDDVPELRLRPAGTDNAENSTDGSLPAEKTDIKIDMTKIVPNPFQPRKVFDEAEIEQLSQSIMTHGLLSPIALRKTEDGYQIIAGERRYRAALRAGWSEIPARIYEADDRQMAELALTENIQRKDLNALEKAASFATYLQTYGGTHEELAKRLEINRSTVSNLLRLLELPQTLQDAVCREQISPGHARAMLKLPEFEQIALAAQIQAEGWSVRETEQFVHDLQKHGEAKLPRTGDDWNVVDETGQPHPVRRQTKQSEHVKQLEEEFRRSLGGVSINLIQTNDKGKGKLVISFANHTEFEQIYAVICRQNRASG
ncbi:MAG: ParB/RepB/Spo0J family partition protein [Planctomycetaceae bacterium]|jgi:ParB family chromosome partitioning protein|nr:ParB/RepB/Spo0J family partition protein [Planctomycetaceae bacterium]